MLKVFLVLLMSIFWLTVSADIAVISHEEKDVQISKRELVAIYLGKSKTFSDGTYVVPLHQPESSDAYKFFTKEVLNKSTKQHKAYWAKKIFTGKGRPPKTISDDQKMLEIVSSDARYIGYIVDKNAEDGIRVVMYYSN